MNSNSQQTWYRLFDSTTGKVYYANDKNGICTWKKPQEGTILDGAVPTWWEIYDTDSQSPYYFNTTTQQTFWSFPENAGVFPIPLTSYDDSMISNKLGKYPDDQSSTIDVRNLPPPPINSHCDTPQSNDNDNNQTLSQNSQDNEKNEWEEHLDIRTGYKYYLHRRTRKLTWFAIDEYNKNYPNDEVQPKLPEPPPPIVENNIEVLNPPISKSKSGGSIPQKPKNPPPPVPQTRPKGMGNQSESMVKSAPKKIPLKGPKFAPRPKLKPSSSFNDSFSNKIHHNNAPKQNIVSKNPDFTSTLELKVSRGLSNRGQISKNHQPNSTQANNPNDIGNPMPSKDLPPLPQPLVVNQQPKKQPPPPIPKTNGFNRPQPQLRHTKTMSSLGTNTNSNPDTSSRKPSPFNRSFSLKVANNKELTPKPLPIELLKEINAFQLEGYAQQYFKNIKKGIFRRTVPIRERLKWSKEPLKEPLLKLNKKFEKNALNASKYILQFMNEKRGETFTESQIKAVEEILAIGLKVNELRDEIYCQLCKQTTLNPDLDSLYNAWNLITCIVQYFPPTKDLEPWLFQYFDENEKIKDDFISKSIAFSKKKIISISRQGAVLRIPGPSEIEFSLTAAYKQTIFGSKLEDIMKYEGEREKVPKIMISILSRLKELNAHQTEGIFRISGRTDDCIEMRIQIEKGNYDFSKYTDPHVPATVLKFWFRSLEEPLIPSYYYWKCIEAIKEDRLDEMNKVIKSLPTINYNTLVMMVEYIQLILRPENQQLTKMGAQSLGIVLGPNFVRCPSSDPKVILESQQWEQRFIISLIKNLEI